MAGWLVKDIMTRQPQSVPEGTGLTEVVALLLRYRLLGMPVVCADGKVVGFVSEQDCLRTLLMASYFCEGGERVENVMHRSPLTLKPDAQVLDVAALMLHQKPKIYPVVDDQGLLLGVLHRHQVLAALNQQLQNCDPAP